MTNDPDYGSRAIETLMKEKLLQSAAEGSHQDLLELLDWLHGQGEIHDRLETAIVNLISRAYYIKAGIQQLIESRPKTPFPSNWDNPTEEDVKRVELLMVGMDATDIAELRKMVKDLDKRRNNKS